MKYGQLGQFHNEETDFQFAAQGPFQKPGVYEASTRKLRLFCKAASINYFSMLASSTSVGKVQKDDWQVVSPKLNSATVTPFHSPHINSGPHFKLFAG